MNRRQIGILWCGILLLAVTAIYPPWIGSLTLLRDPFGFHYQERSGWRWVWHSPKRELWVPHEYCSDFESFPRIRVGEVLYVRLEPTSTDIDYRFLLVEWAVIGAVTFGLILSFRRKP